MSKKFETYRFIRPVDIIANHHSKYVKHNNMHGIVMYFYVDHEHDTFEVGFSVCRDDNFDKEVGKYKAKSSPNRYVFSTDILDNGLTLVKATISYLEMLYPKYKVDRTKLHLGDYAWEGINKLVLKAMRDDTSKSSEY